MSLSLTKYFAPAPKVRAGIAIGRNRVCAVALGAQGDSWEVRSVYQQELGAPLFSGQPDGQAEALLADALRAVSKEFRGDYAAVHVALPDTVIRSAVFEFDELPKGAALRESLLRWRFAEMWQRAEESLECRGLDLGEDNGKHLLLGQAGERSWVACVRGALELAGITPWSLNATAAHRFNCFHDAVVSNSGALLSLEPDCWSLLLWDEAGRVRQVLTRFRQGQSEQEEISLIADEVARAVPAYVDRSGTVGKLFLAGCSAELAVLGKLLDERLHRQALPLHADDGLAAPAAIREGLAPLAMAAALNA